MRIVLLYIALFFSSLVFSQEIELVVNIKDDDNGKNLGGATVEVYSGGKLITSKTSASNGKVPTIFLEPGKVYTFYIKKDGYVTKMAEIDARIDYPEDAPPQLYFPFQTALFAKIEGVDFSFLESTPMFKGSFDSKYIWDYDKKYTESMLKKIEELKKQIVKQKEELEKQEKEKQKQEADFKAYVAAGDKAMKEFKYQIAIDQYTLALDIKKDDVEVKAKLTEAKKKLEEEQKNAQSEKNYIEKMTQANNEFKAKNYEKALSLYTEASQIKTNEKEPKDKIAEITKILADQKANEEKFNKLVVEGDKAVSTQDFNNAISKYEEALKLKQDSAVQTKLDNVKKAKSDKENAEKDAALKKTQFDGIIKEADNLFNTGKYDQAKAKYEAALKVLPDEKYPKDKITECDKKIQEQSAQKELDEKFSAKMTAAQKALEEKKYEEALNLFTEASQLKPGEQLPKDKITQVKALIEKQKQEEKAQKEKDEQFNKFVSEGDVALNNKLYPDAIFKYEAALKIKADPAVSAKIENAKKLQKEQAEQEANAKKLEEDFKKLIAEADKAFDTKNLDLALTKYNEALKIKSNDSHATKRITEINKLKADEKAKEDAEKKKEEEYNKLVKEGEDLFNSGKYQESKTKFEQALNIKKNEAYPLGKIEEINKKLNELEAENKKNEAYQKALMEANNLFIQKKYEEAIKKYNDALVFKPTEQVPKDKINEINKILADQKNETQKEAEYQKFMKEGDAFLANKDYNSALDRYNRALSNKSNDSKALAKIDEINKAIEAKQNAEKKEKEFNDLVTQGNNAFNAKNYEKAIENYKNAIAIKSDAQIDAKIKEAEKLINENKSNAELKAKIDKLKSEADNLYNQNKYEEALKKYQELLTLDNKNVHAEQRVSEIQNKLNAQKSDAEKEKKFNELVAQGDKFASNNEYQKAIDVYKEAYVIKTDADVNRKIIDLKAKIKAEEDLAFQKQSYDKKISEADAKFKSGDWLQAKKYYEDAKKIKPDESYPDNQINLCNQKIQDESTNKVDQNYNEMINKADQFFKDEKYDDAIDYYNRAISIKSEKYPKDQINEIKRIKEEKANQLADKQKLDKDFNDLVKKADEFFNAKNYSAAADKYKQALALKSNDSYVKGRIDEIERLLSGQNQNDQKTQEFNQLIQQADALMKEKKWSDAKAKYEQALTVKSDEVYPKNQIIICNEMMKKEGANEAEANYQKIITTAQKKFDEKDYERALDLYIRAKTIKPSDPEPQRKIDEINQIIANQKNQDSQKSEYDKYIKQADKAFEAKDWQTARKFYVLAYNLNNEKYPDDQIKVIDANYNAFYKEQYDKMIAKADENFDGKNYEKSKELYERAIKLLPNIDNTYPQARIKEIEAILNKPMATNRTVRDLGDPILGATEKMMQAMLADAEEQRKFNNIEKVLTVAEENKTFRNEWAETENTATNDAKDETDQIKEDIEKQAWKAEVEREKTEQKVIQSSEEYHKVQAGIAEYNENVIFRQNNYVEDLHTEISESFIDNDKARVEFLTEVENIHTNIETKAKQDERNQTNTNFDAKEYVNEMVENHVTQDPNMDVARIKTEDNVIDFQTGISDKQKLNTTLHEDEISKTKNSVVDLVKEQEDANINSDVARQETEVKVVNFQDEKSDYNAKLAKDQTDINFDVKKYADHMQDEININNIENDIPRQKMEVVVINLEEEIEKRNADYSTNQNANIFETEDKVVDLKDKQLHMADGKEEKRIEDVENLNEVVNEIKTFEKNLTQDNVDNSHNTKDYVDNELVKTKTINDEADEKTVDNMDKAKNTIEELHENEKVNNEDNQEKVNKTEDFITKNLKDIDVKKIDVKVQNELGEKYPEGVTEEIYEQKDGNGLLIGYVVRRLVVIEGEGSVYEKTQARYGTTYTKNGNPITEYQWQSETNNGNLVRNN